MGGEDVCHRGLPDMTSEERDEGAKKLAMTVAGSLVVVSCVGSAIAEATYRLGATHKAAAKIATLGALDLGWLYIGIYAVTRTVGLVNMYPMIYKARVMRSKSGNLRANMYLYKQVGKNSSDGAIVLDDAGDAGVYNRANRSMHHMVENARACWPRSRGFGPFAACVCACAWSAGRVVHQRGHIGYGSRPRLRHLDARHGGAVRHGADRWLPEPCRIGPLDPGPGARSARVSSGRCLGSAHHRPQLTL